MLRQPAEERNAITDLGNAYLPTSNGRSVPLKEIAKVGLTWEADVLRREGCSYTVTVLSDVVEGLQAPTVTVQVWPKLQELAAKMPPGDTVQIAGAVKESSKGQGSLLANVPLMALIIVNLLMLQLQSFSRARLVKLTAPLGIAGVAAALLILNRPFGFVVPLGFIALVGMMMRNSVILIDKTEQDDRGHPADLVALPAVCADWLRVKREGQGKAA